MKTILHKADTRGFFDFGWLQTHHTFSFGNYYDPDRISFGRLRVLNDDKVAPGQGFGTHPHDNMEIVTIVLSGELAHKDDAGHEQVIGDQEVQIMSAGTGIQHSEYNHSSMLPAKFLQIWVLPDAHGHAPRYDQMWFDPEERINTFQMLVAPQKHHAPLWLHQQTFFARASLTENHELSYALHAPTHGVYLFLIHGRADIAGQQVGERDGIGLWDTDTVPIKALTDANILLIEVPMD